MKYVSKFILYPPSLEIHRVKLLEQFLDEELAIPRNSFGSEVIPIIFEFVKKYYYKNKTEIYTEGSSETEGFEIHLDDEPVSFDKEIQRIRVFYRKE